MPIQAILTDKVPQPGVLTLVGNFVYLAGQGGTHPQTRKLVSDSIEEQTKQMLDASGASMANTIKSTVCLSDLRLFIRFNEARATNFPDPKPVRTTMGSQLLGGMLIKTDAVTHVGKEGTP